MRGASRVAFADARDRLTEVVADADVAATVGDELFAVVRLLDREPGLRRALADYTSAIHNTRDGTMKGQLSAPLAAFDSSLKTVTGQLVTAVDAMTAGAGIGVQADELFAELD